jgi:hypothetical protein
MNEIDAKVLAAAQDYTHERGKPPALLVVHPEIAKRMTTTCFRFYEPSKLEANVFIEPELPPPLLDTIVVDVKILDTSHMEPLEYVLSRDRIDCLDEEQVIAVLMRRLP